MNELVRRGHEVHRRRRERRPPGRRARVARDASRVGGVRIPHRVDRARPRLRVARPRGARALVRRVRRDVVHLWPLAPARTFAAARAPAASPCVREAPNTHTAHAWRVVEEEVALARARRRRRHRAHGRRRPPARWSRRSGMPRPACSRRPSGRADVPRSRGSIRDRILRHQYGYTPRHAPRRTARRRGRPASRAVFVGRGEPRKGLHYALRAWLASSASQRRPLRDHGVVRCPAYRDRSRRARASERRGRAASRRSRWARSRSADVLLLPTIEEGSALVTYEAQGAGCVPLVSDRGRRVIDDGVQGSCTSRATSRR